MIRLVVCESCGHEFYSKAPRPRCGRCLSWRIIEKEWAIPRGMVEYIAQEVINRLGHGLANACRACGGDLKFSLVCASCGKPYMFHRSKGAV